ncbi:MAG: hypothetical protein DSZ05_08495 [Sulfurospirillum sp.]|nr:MAG: hypothetical protein DSZ05_08495 [Sulfurospirillum sp.]
MMKKLSFLILCVLGLTQLQAEQEAPFTYHMGMHFGQNFADNNSKMRDNALYGIRGTVMLTPFYGLVLGYDRLDSIDLKDTSATTDVQRLYGLIEVDGEEQFHVVPYITFGAGYEILSKDVVVNGHKYDISQAYLTGGLGFRYNFIPEMSIFLEGNALWKTDTTDVDYSAIAGFMYHFNATTCDKTYITDRLREKPKERTTIHTGAVNAISGWKKPTLSHKKAPFRKTAFTQKKWENPAPVQKRPVYRHKYVNPKRVVHFRPKNRQNNGYHNGYYVVLGAFKTKRGMHTLLRRLDRKGIPYILKDNRRKRLTYVLCGVYPNQYRAQRALKRLKAVQHDAYIKRMR